MEGKMTARLIVAIISTILEEAAIVIIVRWALPTIDIHIPLPGLVTLMVAWGAWSVFIYRIGSRALRKKLVISLPDMLGGKGVIVSPLVPEGMVRIKGELWVAQSASSEMESGRKVIVVGQEGLKLIVRESGTGDGLPGTT